jgi:hypothetical protein
MQLRRPVPCDLGTPGEHSTHRPTTGPSGAPAPFDIGEISLVYPVFVAYPGRKVHEVLSEFVGTNVIKPTPEQRARLINFVATEYEAGRSLRELAELTGRTQTAVRRALDAAGVKRRGVGAARSQLSSGQPEASGHELA